MTSAVVQLKFTPKRMLTKTEAARHCGRSVKRFMAECPVSPVKFPNGDLLYDVRDLDAWIDDVKRGSSGSADDIVGRLE